MLNNVAVDKNLPAQVLPRVKGRSSRTIRPSVSLAHWCFYLSATYPVARFFSEVVSLAILGCIALISLWFASAGRSQIERLAIVSPSFFSVIIPAAMAFDAGNGSVGKYLIFHLEFIILALAALNIKCVPSPNVFAACCCILGLLMLMFVPYPDIRPINSSEMFGFSGIGDGEYVGSNRLRAFFPQTNDLAMFVSGLFICCLCFTPRPSFESGTFWCNGRALARSMFTLAILGLCLYFSASSTGAFVVVCGILWWTLRPAVVLSLLILTVTILFISQLYFPGEFKDYLQEGSFFWRYYMAEHVMKVSSPLSFDYNALGNQESWTHSFFLDLSLLFGRLGAHIFFFAIVILSIRIRQHTAIALLIVVIAGSVQPAGAMPAGFLMLVLTSFSVARWFTVRSRFSRK